MLIVMRVGDDKIGMLGDELNWSQTVKIADQVRTSDMQIQFEDDRSFRLIRLSFV